MPGVLMIEALAQASALLAFESLDTDPDPNTVYYFAGIDNARFKRPVEPATSWCSRPRWRAPNRRSTSSKARAWSATSWPSRPT